MKLPDEFLWVSIVSPGTGFEGNRQEKRWNTADLDDFYNIKFSDSDECVLIPKDLLVNKEDLYYPPFFLGMLKEEAKNSKKDYLIDNNFIEDLTFEMTLRLLI